MQLSVANVKIWQIFWCPQSPNAIASMSFNVVSFNLTTWIKVSFLFNHASVIMAASRGWSGFKKCRILVNWLASGLLPVRYDQEVIVSNGLPLLTMHFSESNIFRSIEVALCPYSTGIFTMTSSEKTRFILRISVLHLLLTDVSHSWNLTSLNISDDVLIWRFAVWRNRAFLAIPNWANSNNELWVTMYN